MYSVRNGALCVRAADGMRKSASGPDRKTMTLHISKASSDVNVTGSEFSQSINFYATSVFLFLFVCFNRVLYILQQHNEVFVITL